MLIRLFTLFRTFLFCCNIFLFISPGLSKAAPDHAVSATSNLGADLSVADQLDDKVDDVGRLHIQAIILQNSERYDAAEAVLQEAFLLDPKRLSTLIGLSQLYIDSGDYSAARTTIAKVELQLASLSYFERARHHLILGQLHLKLEDVSRAQAHFLEAQSIAAEAGSQPLSVRVLISMGVASSQLGNAQDAGTQFDAARQQLSDIEPSPQKAELYYAWLSAVADHAMRVGSYQEAYDTLAALHSYGGAGQAGITLEIAHRQANALIGMGEFGKAKEIMEIVAPAYVEMFGNNHSTTQAAKTDLKRLRNRIR